MGMPSPRRGAGEGTGLDSLGLAFVQSGGVSAFGLPEVPLGRGLHRPLPSSSRLFFTS